MDASVASVAIKQPTTQPPKAGAAKAGVPPETPQISPPPIDSIGQRPTVPTVSMDVPESGEIADRFSIIVGQGQFVDEGLRIKPAEVRERLNEVIQQKRAAGATGEADGRLNRYDLAYIFGFADKGDWSARSSLKNNGLGADTSKFTEAAYNTFTGDNRMNGTINAKGLLDSLDCYAKYNKGILRLNLSHFVELKTIHEIPVGELCGRLKDLADDPKRFLEFCRNNLHFLREYMQQIASEAKGDWEQYKDMTAEDLAKDKNFLKLFTEPAKYEQRKIISLSLFVDMSNHMEINKIDPPKQKYLADPLARKLYVETVFDTYIVAGKMDKEATEKAIGAVEKFAKNMDKLRGVLADQGKKPDEIDKLLNGLAAEQVNPVFALKNNEKVPALEKLQAELKVSHAQKSNTPDKSAPPQISLSQ